MERRSNPRQLISIGALVHPQQGRSWLCTIRDFCQDGMLLVGSSGPRSLKATGANHQPGDLIHLHFSVPTRTGEQHLRLEASIARLLSDGRGMGVRLNVPMKPSQFDLLMDFAIAAGMASGGASGGSQQATAEPAVPAGAGAAAERPSSIERAASRTAAPRKRSPAQAGAGAEVSGLQDEPELRDARIDAGQSAALREKLLKQTARSLQKIMVGFLERCERELLVRARDAGTNARQMMYFEGLDQLEKLRDKLAERFQSGVLAQIRKVSDPEQILAQRRRRETGDSKRLKLVDTDEFEEWLMAADVISKVEGRFSELLFDARAQLGLLAKPWGHKDVVPIGPSVIVWAFDDALGEMFDVRRAVRADIYRQFERALLAELAEFYPALLETLHESRLFPPIEELRQAMLQRDPASQDQGDADQQPQPGATAPGNTSALTSPAMAPSVPRNPFMPAPSSSAEVYKAARELLSLGRRARTIRGQAEDVPLAPPGAAPERRFDAEDVLSAISEIEREIGDAPLTDERLKSRLVQVLKQKYGGRKAFGEDLYDTLNVMENLVESLEQDHFLTDGIRSWIKRLELTLNKLATKDPQFLTPSEQGSHAAIEFLKLLARLGKSCDVRSGIDRDVGQKVDELLQRVVQEFDRNPDIFSEALSEITPLVERQSTAYRSNVERTVQASEGQQKLAHARRAVIEALAPMLEGRQVPELLLQLLNPGWRNLMVHNHLRFGPESHEWQDALLLAEQLLAHLERRADTDDPSFLEPEQLLKRVVSGLNSISFEPGKRTPLVMALSDAIVGDTAGNRAEVQLVDVPAGGAAAALGLKGLLPETDPDLETGNEEARKSFRKAVDRARRINVGEWLAMTDAQGRPLILTIAFVGDEGSNFVLVNRKGVKSKELPLKEMAEGLFEGHITLLDDFDLPLMERASQRMLQNLHNQLTWQATHDDMTGLYNRKEFERLLGSAIQTARHGARQHALMYVDLDQFKIINNAAGHKAGDELLRLVGERIANGLQAEGGRVARLGGDEFGVLLPNIETRHARDLAEETLELVRGERFEWSEHKFSLSASVGLAFIDEGSTDVDTLMSNVDQACYAAKDAGRNRVQEFEPGDARMMRRHGVMEWVTQLDQALADNRLVLNCQRIAPIDAASKDGVHYEILLTMRDELGDLMPPSEFIMAAETYNRVTLVDRWVVERVFDWMAEHRSELDDVGGFAINVSGHSINDETFSDFVLAQFSRTKVPTSKVCFEITETAAIANLDNARDFMNRMRIIGCRFSLDDFGTGLSSYSYLRNLPVDFVKIDGVFVRELATNPDDYAVVRSINEIGHCMGKKTIAEFVESKEILAQLAEIGVDFAQGFGIEKPVPLEDLQIS